MFLEFFLPIFCVAETFSLSKKKHGLSVFPANAEGYWWEEILSKSVASLVPLNPTNGMCAFPGIISPRIHVILVVTIGEPKWHETWKNHFKQDFPVCGFFLLLNMFKNIIYHRTELELTYVFVSSWFNNKMEYLIESYFLVSSTIHKLKEKHLRTYLHHSESRWRNPQKVD